jgi:hypothetical protein
MVTSDKILWCPVGTEANMPIDGRKLPWPMQRALVAAQR